jgi:hypothetical protein
VSGNSQPALHTCFPRMRQPQFFAIYSSSAIRRAMARSPTVHRNHSDQGHNRSPHIQNDQSSYSDWPVPGHYGECIRYRDQATESAKACTHYTTFASILTGIFRIFGVVPDRIDESTLMEARTLNKFCPGGSPFDVRMRSVRVSSVQKRSRTV